MKELYPNQKEFDTAAEVEVAVHNAWSFSALNKLRVSVVKFMNPALHKLWQDRYWDFKKCPDCAKRKYKG